MGIAPHKNETRLGRAIAAELREIYPVHTGKNVAADLGCSLKSAENLLNGHLSDLSATRVAHAYGLGLLIGAYARLTGEGLEDFIEQQAAEADRAEARARERRGELHVLQQSLSAARRSNLGPRRGRPHIVR